MQRFIPVLFCILSFFTRAAAQDSISLEWCNKKAIEAYPLAKQRDMLSQSNALKVRTLNTNYLPQLYLNGQASYQSDVTELPIKIPFVAVPTMDKDMYKATIDVNQLIYDGKTTTRQKELESAGLEADRQNLESELYKIKERINLIYFNILLLQENEKIINVLLDDLKNKLESVESGVRNGTLMESNADILKAEIMKAEQQLIEITTTCKSNLSVLQIFTGTSLTAGVRLQLPDPAINTIKSENKRLEFLVFDLQKKKLETSKDLISSRNLPRLSAFGQLGYGRPGLNMLKNDFESFYIIGARLNWNIWNWNQVKNDRKIADIQVDMINSQKETFEKNLQMTLRRNLDEIQKLELLIKKDEEIIAFREKVTRTLSSQLDNGVITSTEYLSEFNNEVQAKLNLRAHMVQLSKAKVDYLTTLGVY